MPNSSVFRFRSLIVLASLILIATLDLGAAQRDKNPATLNTPANRNARRIEALKEEVRHQLVTLPYYTVFDWLEAQVKPDGTVTLMGEVTRPTVKDDAEHRVKKLESVSRVIDNIEVLPLSPMDDELRVALYRAIYRFDSPLFRYGTQSVPPIHIIVKNGHVTLKGVVLNEGDSQLAYMAARGVPGTFEVKNELQIEQQLEEKAAKK
ncbi:MAG TPA: BON domain-containing protein [Terriglobia bacterium]|nr:BON domain-containing protein [Terriglobia bacterium]